MTSVKKIISEVRICTLALIVTWRASAVRLCIVPNRTRRYYICIWPYVYLGPGKQLFLVNRHRFRCVKRFQLKTAKSCAVCQGLFHRLNAKTPMT